MTLLELWTDYGMILDASDNPQLYEEIRRAIAIAQAVDEVMADDGEPDPIARWVLERADELLHGGKEKP